jgi:hypothetical protein
MNRKPLAKIGKRKPLCPVCKTRYTRTRVGQTACSVACVIARANKNIEKAKVKAVKARAKQTAKNKREFNESDKTWCRGKAKEQLHRWIQYVRDVGMPCISCGNTNPNIKYDAGHFRSVGSAKELEMEPRNIHKQCSLNCNQHLSSNRAGYEAGLIERYGVEYLDWLKGPHEPKHYKASDYLEIRDKYKELNRAAGVLKYQNKD